MTVSPNRRSTKRGRPLVTDGAFRCSRCQRMANQRRTSWPGEQLCYSCFYAAMKTRGICPQCSHDGILPGLADDPNRRPICLSCARIPGDFTCRGCGIDGAFYRRGTCARCSLRQDLTALMIDGAQHQDAMAPIVEALCRVERPESILSWKRSPRVRGLLTGLATGDIPLTHVGLDEAGSDEVVHHLRSMLEHAGVLAARDEPLARFERWLSVKLEVLTEPAVRGPVEQFATWHHLRRLRQTTVPGQDSAAAVRYAKQEVTEAIKFLTWLHSTHHRTLATCLQLDVDQWLASGPTTRLKIRNLLAWAKKAQLNRSVHITHRQAPPIRSLTQQQRLGWLRELLAGDFETLPYRVAGTLLLLFAQPLTRIAALPTSAVAIIDDDVQISLGREPIPVPQPFADMLIDHTGSRPNLRAAGGIAASPWLFPGFSAGRHVDPQVIRERLERLGIDLLGARNTTLQSLVGAAPPPVVAELLGYSYATAQLHAEIAAQPWARYVTKAATTTKMVRF
jgi:hypothetical protein